MLISQELISLSGSKVLYNACHEYFCHKNGKERRARPIYTEQEMRKSDLRNNCSRTYLCRHSEVPVQFINAQTELQKILIEYHVFLMCPGLLSNPSSTSKIFSYGSNNSNATLPVPCPILIIFKLLTCLSLFCLALVCSTVSSLRK